MSGSAIVTETVAGEPCEKLVLLLDLYQLRPPAALSATVTDSTLLAGGGSADEVTAVSVVDEAGAFTAVALRANPYANLVELGRLGTGRDKPVAAALIAFEDVVAVKLEKAKPAKDVPWLQFGGGWVSGLLYTLVDHKILLVVRASGELGPSRGGFFII